MTYQTIQIKALPTAQIQPAEYYDLLILETKWCATVWAPAMLALLKTVVTCDIDDAPDFQDSIKTLIESIES